VVGVIAALQTLSTARRGEVAALRALGVPARTQANARMLELAAVGAGALLLGVGTGAVAAAVTVPRLVDAVAAQVGAATPAIAGIPLAAALTALAVGLGGAAVWTARDVRRLASRATVGEDAR
jgi:ABC-type lipoprotein release transport system permease subunit